MPTVVTALLLGLLAGANGVMQTMWDGFERPIVVGPLVGLIMGDVGSGLVIGATIELVYMGLFAIGGAQPPDVITAGVLGTAFAISAGAGPAEALAIALPASMLASTLWIGMLTLYAGLIHKADSYAEEGNVKGIGRLHFLGGLGMFLLYFLMVFVSYLVGKDAVANILNAIPQWLQDGISVASGVLPALGFALLLNILWRGALIPYLVLGFVLVVYLELPLIAVAIVSAAMALLHDQFTNKKAASAAAEGGTNA